MGAQRTGNGPRRLSGDDLIVEIAWKYYNDGLNQGEIADLLDISRSTVVNHLQEARLRDYVRVSLHPSVFERHKLAERLCARFGLKAACIVPRGHGDDEDALKRVARGAADWLPDLLEPSDRLGVSWGRTVFEVAEAVAPTRIADLTVTQLVGSKSTPYGFEAETCSSILALQLGARCINLHAPLVVSDADLAARLRAEPVIADQLQAVNACNKTIFAAGSCTPESHIVTSGVVDRDQLRTYVSQGATGVVCGRFIDTDGNLMPGEIDERMISVTLDQMRGKQLGLLVSLGADKVKPMIAAIRGGYATHLATCTENGGGDAGGEVRPQIGRFSTT